jgi:hypothetical protein
LVACGGAPKKRSNIIYYEDVEGKIVKIPLADRMIIKTDLGETRVVVVTEDTEFKRDGDDCKFKDYKENDPVKIKGNTDPENNVFMAGTIESGDRVKPGQGTPGSTLNNNPAGQ